MGEGLSQKPQLHALTSVRFFFAAMVLVVHFVQDVPTSLSYVPGFLYYLGGTAVSWFFVLSGFIITYNYPTLSNAAERKGFLISRVVRLWPVHALTLIAVILLKGGGKYYPFFFTMTQAWTANPEMTSAYNFPSWSISDEMFFYVAYVGLVAPARWLRVMVFAGPLALGVALPTLHGCFLPIDNPASTAGSGQCAAFIGSFPPARLIEFLAGVALCRFRPRVPQMLGLAAALIVAAGYVPTMTGLDGNSLAAHLLWQAEVVLGGGALIASLSRPGWLSNLLGFRPLVIGGEISYAMYMSHQVVNYAVLPRVANLGPAATFILVTGITLAVSAGLFFLVEKPVRDAVKIRLRRRLPKRVEWSGGQPSLTSAS